MAIDWFTVGAQIVNFLVLVWLLKKFLYRPVLKAMHSREQGLVQRQQQIDNKLRETGQLQHQYEAGLQQLTDDKEKILAEAKSEAEADRLLQLQGLNEEMQAKKKQFADEMVKLQQDAAAELTRMIADRALQLGEKVLSTLADQSLEQRMVERFLNRLDNLAAEQQDELQNALRLEESATVVTGFPMDETTADLVRQFLNRFGQSDTLFKRDEKLICGITLEAGGRTWEWNIERYLTELESELSKPADVRDG